MVYGVFETESFSRLYDSLPKEEQEWIKKMISQLEENAFVGKPLRYSWFREKKYGGKRLYYLIYQNVKKVLLVAFGSKKEQRKIIAHILSNIDEYKNLVGSIQ